MSETTQKFDVSTVLTEVIADAKKIVFSPVTFYKEMPHNGGFANPAIFAAAMAFAMGVIFAIYSLFGMKFGGAGLASIIMFPIMGLIGSFIGGAILFVIWKLMGSEKNYETAYRCVAYSYAIAPVLAAISFIPYLAGIVKTLWGSFLMFTASKEVHQIKAKTAKLVFGILAGIGVLFGISSEHTARNYISKIEKYTKDAGFDNIENMTPEQLGENTGKFLEGLNRALEEANKGK